MADISQTISDMDETNIIKSVACDLTELKNHYHCNKTDLTVIAQNICSVYNCNFDDLMTNLSSLSFDTDIIILTECRLEPHKPIPQLNDYMASSSTAYINQNDGVVVYVKKTLKPKISEVKLTHASCLQIDVHNHTILGIYRSPSFSNPEKFINSLSNYLTKISSSQNIIVAGDININLAPKLNERLEYLNNRMSYLNTLSSHGILPGHTLPTRKNSCLDHFMLKINNKKHSAFTAILNTTITDHKTTFLCISKVKNKIIPQKTLNKIDFENALKYLQNKNLSNLLFCSDPNIIAFNLTQNIIESIKENSKTTRIAKNQRTIKPWMTKGILRCIHNRNKLQKQSNIDPENITKKITFTRYRNFLNNLIKKTKRNYERNLINNSLKNNKQLWQNIKKLTYTAKNKSSFTELSNIKPTPLESANYVNDFFTNIGKNLANDILSSHTTSAEIDNYIRTLPGQPQSFTLLETDIAEVVAIIRNLKPDSAPGWDNISTRFIQYTCNYISPIIVHLVNVCFETSTFPTVLKTSIVTPIHKGGDVDDVNNYRPISVITVLAKILEKILNGRLINYLNKYKILSNSQFGFRNGVSTEDAVSSLTSTVTKNLDNGVKSISCFLDLKKAFDTVSVSILLQKLEKIGIRGKQQSLFRDYLSGRTQRVKLGGGIISDSTEVTCGVPQGSVLGPTLFLVYINDLCNMSLKDGTIFTYADDTAIVFTGSTWNDALVNAEEGLTKVAVWLKLNLLTLNTSKTNYLCHFISSKTRPPVNFSLKIHTCDNLVNTNCICPTITRVTQTKYLGIIVDERLSWYPQIEQVTARIRKFVWIFKTLRHIASKLILNNIYVALVQSVITYCIRVWGGALKTRFLEAERAQRTLLKVMYFKKRLCPTTDLYVYSDLLSVRKLYILKLILNKHKTLPFTSDVAGRGRRRKTAVATILPVNTQFAASQLESRAAIIYNKINKNIYIYNKSFVECKSMLLSWLKDKTYDELEAFISTSSI